MAGRKMAPDKIFNVDETGITTVPKSLPKIISTKGKKQVGLLTSAKRGQLVKSQLERGQQQQQGSYMPPLFIFPRKRFKSELMNNAPRGFWAECHESGWIQKEIFTKWFQKFIVFSRASIDNPVLLLLDGHASHTKNLQLINLARENGVHIISFPHHCTNRLQPLDVAFMKPLSAYYSDVAKQWLRTHPGRIITQFQISELVGKAFEKAATIPTAHNAFRKTGIWPPDSDVFTEADFIAADTTHIEETIESIEKSSENIQDPQPCCSKYLPIDVEKDTLQNEDNDSYDNVPLARLLVPPKSDSLNNSFIVSPTQIIPMLKAIKQKGLKEVKTKVNFDDSASKKVVKCQKIQNTVSSKANEESSDEGEDAECLYCHYLYSRSTEGWIQCTKCAEWAHCSCAGVEDEDDEAVFICEQCMG
ncbi:hypothetical protein NQ318_012470 [Aromia moschata]|uniref:DDE-1 domain-containing protein n=1 Tax=Aromia moschata TaxID=1265417 RepID=A0AAV8X7G8_9CUCU|nr:hypothetical protein NQ318_012470 [Aromia moschata]